jgi:hypothetical protein
MMKANMPKVFNQLSKNEQTRILQKMEDAMDDELCLAQFVWIKMACSILHDLGLTESQITQFIGSWKMMYRANSRFKDKAEQDAFLDKRMAEIFGEGGFPEEFMQSMKDIGRG